MRSAAENKKKEFESGYSEKKKTIWESGVK
jgi:hypothetical protein